MEIPKQRLSATQSKICVTIRMMNPSGVPLLISRCYCTRGSTKGVLLYWMAWNATRAKIPPTRSNRAMRVLLSVTRCVGVGAAPEWGTHRIYRQGPYVFIVFTTSFNRFGGKRAAQNTAHKNNVGPIKSAVPSYQTSPKSVTKTKESCDVGKKRRMIKMSAKINNDIGSATCKISSNVHPDLTEISRKMFSGAG